MGYPTKWEAPLLGRSIDLVFLKDDSIISVEFKLKNWRRALEQARDHQLGADFAYICLPRTISSPSIYDEAESAGIGVMIYTEKGNWPFEILIPAKKSEFQWSVARRNLLISLSEMSHEPNSGI
jgi:hypothetical protein